MAKAKLPRKGNLKSEKSAKSRKSSRSSGKALWVFIAFVVIVVVIFAVTGDDDTNVATTDKVEVNTELIQNEVDIGEDEVVLGEAVVEADILAEPAETDDEGEIVDEGAAKDRDEQRVKDMENVRDAMAKYFKDHDAYPGELEMLVPEYLDAVPVNPTPGGSDYSLTGIGAEVEPGNKLYKYYDLVYVLEVGAKGIEEGLHVANPDGIALP